MTVDETLWNRHSVEFFNMVEAFEAIDQSIKELIGTHHLERYLDVLYWGLRMEGATAFFHVTSSRNRYEHMRLHGKLNSTFEIET
jgi:hypothetical protein